MFRSKEETLRRFKNKLELNDGEPSGSEALDRRNYNTDEEYLSAVTDYNMKRNDPQRQKVYAKARQELEEQRIAEDERQFRETMDANMKNYELSDTERKRAAALAEQRVNRDLMSGKVSALNIAQATRDAVTQAENEIKRERAISAAMSQRFREEIQRSRFKG